MGVAGSDRDIKAACGALHCEIFIGSRKLVLHPEKTKIVYCKDANRWDDFPVIAFDFLGYQFRTRKSMWGKGEKRIIAHNFLPAASPKALKRMRRTIRRWALHHRSDKSLTDLAELYNPYIRGWINYYGHFYKTQLYPTLTRIDAYVIRWAHRKFKRMRHRTKGDEIGLTGSAGPTRISSLTGSYAMATAELREPCESRGSRTVLGAPGGEIPPGDSTISPSADCLLPEQIERAPNKCRSCSATDRRRRSIAMVRTVVLVGPHVRVLGHTLPDCEPAARPPRCAQSRPGFLGAWDHKQFFRLGPFPIAVHIVRSLRLNRKRFTLRD